MPCKCFWNETYRANDIFRIKYHIFSRIQRLMHLCLLLPFLFCPSQATASSWPHLALCISQKCRRKMRCLPTAASQSTNTVERLARAMEPGSLLWVGNNMAVTSGFGLEKEFEKHLVCGMLFIRRPYGVHPISAGQFPVRWGAGGAQRGASLHRIGVPKPHHPMAKGWPAITHRLPLDTAHHWPHYIRPEAWGQRQLHLRSHKQLRLQRGDRSPQCHRWVNEWNAVDWSHPQYLMLGLTPVP